MNYDNCCPICFNEFDLDICDNLVNIAITKCNHKFCLSCIILHSRSKYTCPLCRGEFISPDHTSFSLFGQDDDIIQRELEIASNIQRDMEVNSWYFGNNQDHYQEPIMPRINISYDASNVTFSYRDNNQTNENDNINLYHLESSIYDMALSFESTDIDDDESQDASSNGTFSTL